MKVLVIHCTYNVNGGEDAVVQEELCLLRSQGVETALLRFNNNKALLKLLQLPFNLGTFMQTKKAVRAFRPDIVHVHNLHFGASPSVLCALKALGVPFVMTLHNFRLICPSGMLFNKGKLFLHSLTEGFPWTAVRKGVYRNSKVLSFWLALSVRIHRQLGTWQSCNRYIALTEHARSIMLRSRLSFSERQIAVKPNFSAFHNPGGERSNAFLFVGRLSEEKGLRLLLEAFSELDLPLRIAGEGPLLELVEEYAGSFPNIHYLGRLNREEVGKELQSCSALVFPSLWFEGMPMTIIESFACGLPVIASDLGAMQSMIAEGITGLRFTPGSKEALKEKVLAWNRMGIEEKEVFRKAVQAEFERNYTPQKNGEALIRIYSDVLQEVRTSRPPLVADARIGQPA